MVPHVLLCEHEHVSKLVHRWIVRAARVHEVRRPWMLRRLAGNALHRGHVLLSRADRGGQRVWILRAIQRVVDRVDVFARSVRGDLPVELHGGLRHASILPTHGAKIIDEMPRKEISS